MTARDVTIAESAEFRPRRRARSRRGRFAATARAVFRRQPIATIIVTIFLAVGALAPLLAPHDPKTIHMRDRLQGPSHAYWLGTDEYGRDLLSRVMFGARIAFQAGVIAV